LYYTSVSFWLSIHTSFKNVNWGRLLADIAQFSMLYRMCTDPSSRHINNSPVTVYAMYISRVLFLSHLLSHM